MEEINELFSANLRRLREARRMSLDEVSRLSGVSKSMLGQIERGEVNPTISTVWENRGGFESALQRIAQPPAKRMRSHGYCQYTAGAGG